MITNKKNKKIITVVLIIVLIIVAIGYFVFLKKSDQLQELENLSSVVQLKTGHEINRWLKDKEYGFTGPVYAEIRVEYEPINDYTKEDVYYEIVDILKNNGWQGDSCKGCVLPSYMISLEQKSYPIPITGTVMVHSDENIISISMMHPMP